MLEVKLDTSTALAALDELEQRIKALPTIKPPKPEYPKEWLTPADVDRLVDKRVEQILREITGIARSG